MIARVVAALPGLLIVSGGLLALWGSYGPWGTCSSQPCGGFGGLPYLVSTSGIEFGTGVATAVVAIALAFIGIAALAPGDAPVLRHATSGLVIVEFILVAVHIAGTHVFARHIVYGPEIGLLAVIAGAGVAAIGRASLGHEGGSGRT